MFNIFKKKEPQLTGAEMALLSLQRLTSAINNREISLQQGKLSPDIYAHLDRPDGGLRLTYVMFSPTEQNKPIAKVALIMRHIYENAPLFDIDWAVAPSYQRKNWGLTIAHKALAEFKHGMKGKQQNGFWLEAIVEHDNEASKRIASRLIGGLQILKNDKNEDVYNYRNHFV